MNIGCVCVPIWSAINIQGQDSISFLCSYSNTGLKVSSDVLFNSCENVLEFPFYQCKVGRLPFGKGLKQLLLLLWNWRFLQGKMTFSLFMYFVFQSWLGLEGGWKILTFLWVSWKDTYAPLHLIFFFLLCKKSSSLLS